MFRGWGGGRDRGDCTRGEVGGVSGGVDMRARYSMVSGGGKKRSGRGDDREVRDCGGGGMRKWSGREKGIYR